MSARGQQWCELTHRRHLPDERGELLYAHVLSADHAHYLKILKLGYLLNRRVVTRGEVFYARLSLAASVRSFGILASKLSLSFQGAGSLPNPTKLSE